MRSLGVSKGYHGFASQRRFSRHLTRYSAIAMMLALAASLKATTELSDPLDANGPLPIWAPGDSITTLTVTSDIPGKPNPVSPDSWYGRMTSEVFSGSYLQIYGQTLIADTGTTWSN